MAPPDSAMMDTLIARIEMCCIASCGCLTKTPDFHCHAEDCRYRVLNEAIEHIAGQAATIANQAKVFIADSLTIAELRLCIRDSQEDLHNYRTSAEAEIAQLRQQLAELTSNGSDATHIHGRPQ